MPGHYQKYPGYKDSGIQWLGQIPAHWGLVNGKWLFPERNIKALKTDKQLTASQKHGVIYQEDFMALEGQKVVQVFIGSDILKHVEPNDFVISMRSFQGGIEYCAFRGCVSSAYVPLVSKPSVCISFFRYLLKCGPYIQGLQSTTNLVRDGQALRYSNFAQVLLPDIPHKEQENIAKFLDSEIPQIDTLIDKQQQLIKLLKEKRQAVISHAVTKGLNPAAPMKDSGVEWLGEVPEHWGVGRIKHLAIVISKGTTPTTIGGDYLEEGIQFLKAENVGKQFYVSESPKFYISNYIDEQLSRSRLQENDVLVIIAGATTGLCSVLTANLLPANTNQAVSFIRPKNKVYAAYIAHWLGTSFAQSIIWQGAVQAAQPNLSMENLGNISIPIPPEEEVLKILAKLEIVQDKQQKLSDLAEAKIKLLQERRTALISAAVTGKIDVRNWQPAR